MRDLLSHIPEGGISMSKLADRLRRDPSSVRERCKRLAYRGYVEIVRVPLPKPQVIVCRAGDKPSPAEASYSFATKRIIEALREKPDTVGGVCRRLSMWTSGGVYRIIHTLRHDGVVKEIGRKGQAAVYGVVE